MSFCANYCTQTKTCFELDEFLVNKLNRLLFKVGHADRSLCAAPTVGGLLNKVKIGQLQQNLIASCTECLLVLMPENY